VHIGQYITDNNAQQLFCPDWLLEMTNSRREAVKARGCVADLDIAVEIKFAGAEMGKTSSEKKKSDDLSMALSVST
jgi:hypothetical protein